jgi:hypothetical protein
LARQQHKSHSNLLKYSGCAAKYHDDEAVRGLSLWIPAMFAYKDYGPGKKPVLQYHLLHYAVSIA